MYKSCTDTEGNLIQWAKMVDAPNEAARFENALANYYKNGSIENTLQLVAEIAALDNKLAQLAISQLKPNQDKPIPIVWAPDGAIFLQDTLKKNFAAGEINHQVFACKNPERRHRLSVPKEAIKLAEECGQIILAEDVIRTGQSLHNLLSSLGRFNGKVIIVATQIDKEKALGRRADCYFIDIIEGKNLTNRSPLDIKLVAAYELQNNVMPVETADLALSLYNKWVVAQSHELEQFKWIGEMLVNRKHKIIPTEKSFTEFAEKPDAGFSSPRL